MVDFYHAFVAIRGGSKVSPSDGSFVALYSSVGFHFVEPSAGLSRMDGFSKGVQRVRMFVFEGPRRMHPFVE